MTRYGYARVSPGWRSPAGRPVERAAAALGISRATHYRHLATTDTEQEEATA